MEENKVHTLVCCVWIRIAAQEMKVHIVCAENARWRSITPEAHYMNYELKQNVYMQGHLTLMQTIVHSDVTLYCG